MTVQMAVNGFKAIKSGIASLTRDGGIFSRSAPLGEEALATNLRADVEIMSVEAPVLRSATVEVLTTEDASALPQLSDELGGAARRVSTAVEQTATEESAVPESVVSEVQEVSRVARTASTTGTAAAESGSLASTAAAVLGPALLIITVVSEIVSAIHAGQTHDKLEAAAKKLDGLIDQSTKGQTDMKGVYKQLLQAALADVRAYNELIPDLYAISHEPSLNGMSFSTDGISLFIDNMDGITTEANGTAGYQAAALQNLNEALVFIRQQATNESAMTEVVKQLKTHMQSAGLTDIADSDPFLNAVTLANSLPLTTVQAYNQYRRDIAAYSSVLLPYHQQIQQMSTLGSVATTPSTVQAGTANTGFVPRPLQFVIPTIPNGAAPPATTAGSGIPASTVTARAQSTPVSAPANSNTRAAAQSRAG